MTEPVGSPIRRAAWHRTVENAESFTRRSPWLRDDGSDADCGTDAEAGHCWLMIPQELSGDGMIIIDGQNVETVYYWLSVVPEAGPVIAEGSISGPEEVMRKIKNAKVAKLTLMDGPTVALQCHGGRNGTRWVRCRRDR